MTKRATRFVVHRGWKILIMDMGLNPSHVLALAGLPADLFSRDGASLSPAEYFKLWGGLEEAAGGEELPLKIGKSISVEVFDPPVFASLCSPDLNTALQRLAQYKPLIGPLTMELAIDKDQTSITLGCYGYKEEMPRWLGASELVFFTNLARLAIRKKIIPVLLELPQLPGNLEQYFDYFGASLQQGESVRIGFSADDARLPFLTEDCGMWDFFEAGLKQRLSDLEMGTSVSQRVKSILLEMLPSGQSSIEEAASRLAMSKRSLQRYLRQESSSYKEILNDTRKELAQHYLASSAISPPEISYLLGYQDSNSFLRAFKLWTGTTPGEFRNSKSELLH